jgi:hypothetical protein
MDRNRVGNQRSAEQRSAERCSAGSRRRRRWSLLGAITVALTIAPAATASAASFGAEAWGYNASGQLGNGSTAISRVAVPVQGLTGVIAIAAGGEHSLALLGNGTVMAWGSNREGQLGTGNTTASHVPVAVPGLTGVTAIAAGKQHSLALLANGTVMAWGANLEGQLGSGSKALKSTVPVAVKALSAVKAIAAGGEHSLALLSNGTVMSWGANAEGQLGNGKFAKSNVPVTVKALSGAAAVAAGEEHSLALLAGGTVMAWGANEFLQLGTQGTLKKVGGEEPGEEPEYEEIQVENSNVPLPVQKLTGVTAVAAGRLHNLALLGDGTVMAWGDNELDQLGGGTSGGTTAMPSAVSGLGGVSAISAGGGHSLALLAGGTVTAWGYNPDGQLGNGANVNSPVPVAIKGLGEVAGVAGGGYHSLSFGPPAPTVTGVNPNRASLSGGVSITISGANFEGVTAVQFGTAPASSFTVDSPTSITAVAPAGTGVVDVTVTTPVATSAARPPDRFTYVPPPSLKKIAPNSGPAAGGTSVTVSGASFEGVTAVDFGAAAATSFTVNSSSSITALAPAAPAGFVDVRITTLFGVSAIVKTGRYKYLPTVTEVSPNNGPASGGTTVTVTGSGFVPGSGTTAFKLGTPRAKAVNCSSTTTCVMNTPPGAAGVVDVRAVASKVTSAINPLTDQFTYG